MDTASATTDQTHRPARIPALDGLRGLAILLIVAHNAGSVTGGRDGVLKLWALVSNAGWVGVQLFFALSGFLITRILLDSKGEAGYFRSFYVRRILRIVPLFYAYLAFIFFVTPHVATFAPLAPDLHGSSSLWYWAYLCNWIAPFGMPTSLVHLWSLAVEEQFYVLWPLVVLALTKRSLARVCLLMFVASLLARGELRVLFGGSIGDIGAYTFTVSRWDAIALGALVAVVVRDLPLRATLSRYVPAALGVVLIALLASIAIERGLPAKGTMAEFVGQPLSAILSALCVFACVVGSSSDSRLAGRVGQAMSRALSVNWLATIGKYSYAIYVFHTPVRLMLGARLHDAMAMGNSSVRFLAHLGYVGTVFAISMTLALVSWNVLERPILALKRYFPTPGLVPR